MMYGPAGEWEQSESGPEALDRELSAQGGICCSEELAPRLLDSGDTILNSDSVLPRGVPRTGEPGRTLHERLDRLLLKKNLSVETDPGTRSVCPGRKRGSEPVRRLLGRAFCFSGAGSRGVVQKNLSSATTPDLSSP